MQNNTYAVVGQKHKSWVGKSVPCSRARQSLTLFSVFDFFGFSVVSRRVFGMSRLHLVQ